MKRGTVLMLLFIAAVYSLTWYGNSQPEEEDEVRHAPPSAISTEDITARENAFKENLLKNPTAMAWISGVLTFLLAGGISANMYLLSRKLRKLPIIHRSSELMPSPWPVYEVFNVFVFIFFAEAVLLLAEGILYLIFDLHPDREFYLVFNSLVRDTATALFVVWLVKKKYRASLAHIGLSGSHAVKNIFSGFLVYLSVIPFLALLLVIISHAVDFFKYEAAPQQVVQIYLKPSTDSFLIAFTLFVAIAGPLIEEVFFRGFMYKTFRTRWGVKTGIVLSSLLFAMLHHSVVAFVPIFLLGVVLAAMYEKSGSLLPSMAFHMTHNFLMVGFTLTFKNMSA